jgi:hypothetical protein
MATKKPAKGSAKKPAGKAAVKIEKAKAQQWTRNRGKMPVAPDVWVAVRLRNGKVIDGTAENFEWPILGKPSEIAGADIMAWRRVRKPKPAKAEPVTIEDLAREASKAGCAVRVSFDDLPKPAHTGNEQPAGQVLSVADSGDGLVVKAKLDAEWPSSKAYVDSFLHPLASQLDLTTPAVPVWDGHRDGDADGLGAARGIMWGIGGTLAAVCIIGTFWLVIRVLVGG